jgi:hypothetical protein
MLVSVNGVNPAFKNQVISIVEGFDFANFKNTTVKGQMTTSVVFECDSNDENLIIPAVKKGLKSSEIGSLMMFNVAPYGQPMWIPKK